MKQLASTYSITGASVTLTGVNVPLNQILLISDATTGNVLYSMAGPSASSYTQAANSVITLASTPGDSDKLTVYYDDGVAPANAPTSVSVSNFPATQPVSGTVAISGTIPVSGPLTDTQLRASAVPVSGTVTANVTFPTVQPVSLASVPSHAVTNAGTFAVQATGTVTANAGTNLNTSALALESGGNLATVATKMSDGTQTTKIVNGANTLAVDSSGAITANNAANSYTTVTTTGAVSAGGLLGSVITLGNCRELTLQYVSWGSSGNPGSITVQVSNDSTNWTSLFPSGYTAASYNLTGGASNWKTTGFAYARVIANNAITAGTTVYILGLSQQITGSPVQTVTLTGTAQTTNIPTPAAANGFSSYHSLVSAASTNATLVKNSNGVIGTLILTNTAATWAYFKLVNKTTAPTTGTDTAVINIGVAPNTTLDCSTAFAGLRMSTGVAYYVSGGSSLTDNTALAAAGTFLVNMTYV